MTVATADLAIHGQCDRFAKLRQAAISSWTGGTDFWARADAAADETYENRVKSQYLTDLDNTILAASIGDQAEISQWFTVHGSYFGNATTSSEPGLGLSAPVFESYLSLRKARVPYHFAELYYDRYGSRLSPEFVFPKGTWAADLGTNSASVLHLFGSSLRTAGVWAWTASAGAISNTYAPVILDSDAGSTATAAVVTCTLQDLSTKNITVTTNTYPGTPATFTASTQFVVGQEALGGDAVAAQKVVLVAATGQFKAGEWVLLTDSDTLTGARIAEVAQIDSIVLNTSLTMVDNLLGTWVVAVKAATVWPLFTDAFITSTVTAGTNTDVISCFARPDRAITL